MPHNILSPKARISWCLHFIKAITRQHHTKIRPFLEAQLTKDSVVIDIGAHAGQFTKLFSSLVPNGHVYAFEPGSYALSILKKVKTIHRLDNVKIIPVGLSDKTTTATLYMPVKKSGSMGYGLSNLIKTENRKEIEEKISMITLDDFILREGIEKVDLIKADIEGWELKMLQGAKSTLKKYKPVLMLEACDKWLQRAGDSRQALFNFLTELDYEIYGQNNDGNIVEIISDYDDIICLPKQ